MVQWAARILTLVIVCCALQHAAKAQSYHIRSFEGENATLKLKYMVRTSRTLAVSYLKDSLFLREDQYFLAGHIIHRACMASR